jgi:hypothetical protein
MSWTAEILDPYVITQAPPAHLWTDPSKRRDYAQRMTQVYDDRIRSVQRSIRFLTNVYWFGVVLWTVWLVWVARWKLLRTWWIAGWTSVALVAGATAPWWMQYVGVAVVVVALGVWNVSRRFLWPNWLAGPRSPYART